MLALFRLGPVYLRYIIASVASLSIDVATFFTLMTTGVRPGLAAGVGYGTGIGVHWILSSWLVFDDANTRTLTFHQLLLFILSGFVGLLLTISIIEMATIFGIDPRPAKLLAVAVSFQTVWLMRRYIVFPR